MGSDTATLIVSVAATVAAGTGVIVLSVNGIHSQFAALQTSALRPPPTGPKPPPTAGRGNRQWTPSGTRRARAVSPGPPPGHPQRRMRPVGCAQTRPNSLAAMASTRASEEAEHPAHFRAERGEFDFRGESVRVCARGLAHSLGDGFGLVDVDASCLEVAGDSERIEAGGRHGGASALCYTIPEASIRIGGPGRTRTFDRRIMSPLL